MNSSNLLSSLCGDDEVELSGDVHLTRGVSSPVPLRFSLVSMGLRLSALCCSAFLRTRKKPTELGKQAR